MDIGIKHVGCVLLVMGMLCMDGWWTTGVASIEGHGAGTRSSANVTLRTTVLPSYSKAELAADVPYVLALVNPGSAYTVVYQVRWEKNQDGMTSEKGAILQRGDFLPLQGARKTVGLTYKDSLNELLQEAVAQLHASQSSWVGKMEISGIFY